MDMFGQSWFDTASNRMDWASARQKAVAENMANADTKGYVGRDVVSFEDHLGAVEAGGRAPVRIEEARNSWGGSFDGNQVVIEEQMFLSNEAQSHFNLASSLYKKGHGLLGLALSGR